jgi:hypothetical protein
MSTNDRGQELLIQLETALLRREYPTLFHFHKRNPTQRLDPLARRGH